MVAEKSNTHGGFGGHAGVLEQRSGSGGSFAGGVGNELGEGIGKSFFSTLFWTAGSDRFNQPVT
jgi:hypothetical protein